MEAVPCMGGCWAASVTTTHCTPAALHSQLVTTTKMSPDIAPCPLGDKTHFGLTTTGKKANSHLIFERSIYKWSPKLSSNSTLENLLHVYIINSSVLKMHSSFKICILFNKHTKKPGLSITMKIGNMKLK